MDTLALFGIGVAFSFAAWGVVTARYLWPKLRILPRCAALPADASRLPLRRPRLPRARSCRAGLASRLRPSSGLRRPRRSDPRAPSAGRARDLLGPCRRLALQPLGRGRFALWVLSRPLRSRFVPRVLGCRVPSYHSDCSAPLDHTRVDVQAAPTTPTISNSAWVTACRRS